MKLTVSINYILIALVTFAIIAPLTTIKTQAQAYRGLVIDEFRYVIEHAEGGDTFTKTFTVTHDFSEEDKVVKLYFRSADFKSDGVSGTPRFLPKGYLAPEASLSSWITFEKEGITLDHYGQKEEVTFTITVPENTEPGGKYAAVLLSDKAGESVIVTDDEDTQLGLTKELGPLVIMTVGGETSEGLHAESLYTTNIEGKGRRFFFNPPVNIITELANVGNIHTIPRGVFYIYKGRDFQNYIEKLEINPKNGYILPDSTRQFASTWDNSFLSFYQEKEDDGTYKVKTRYNWNKLSKLRIGKYNVKLLYNTTGENGEVQTMEMFTSFWVFPWQLIVIIVLFIINLYLKYKKKQDEQSGKKREKKVAKKKKLTKTTQ